MHRSESDPDQTNLRCHIAELESIIRELKNRPHPRWLADRHDVRKLLSPPPSRTPPVDSASESRAPSRPPKRKTATKAAAKNSLDAFFDSVLESDDDHLTAPYKRRRIKLEQRDSDSDDCPPCPSPPFRHHHRRQVEPARISFPPTPGHFYPPSESGSDTSDDIPLAHGMARQPRCSQGDLVQADAESVINSASKAIQTSPAPSPFTLTHCTSLTIRSLYTSLLYFATALRDAWVMLEAVHGGPRGDDEEERGGGDCELWTRVKALEE